MSILKEVLYTVKSNINISTLCHVNYHGSKVLEPEISQTENLKKKSGFIDILLHLGKRKKGTVDFDIESLTLGWKILTMFSCMDFECTYLWLIL